MFFNKTRKNDLHNMANSKFVRTISLRIVSVFLIILIAITAIAFFSFTTEINNNMINERENQLKVVESTLSKRMTEMSSIAYSIGNDKSFLLTPIDDSDYAGQEMCQSLGRYLAGNDFIEHLAYYRLSEPDKLYASSGELSFHDFWRTYLGLDQETSDFIIYCINHSNSTEFKYMSFGSESNSYFAYSYSLPQLSKNPQAYVLMMIPLSKVKPILETPLENCSGEIAILNPSGEELYHYSNLGEEFQIDLTSLENGSKIRQNGRNYIVQKVVSASNGYIYVSVIRLNDIISPAATRQVVFIALTLLLTVIAILVMVYFIIVQYKPINSLAMTLTNPSDTSGRKQIIDEESLLSDTFTTLKDDSDQKQKFEAAYIEASEASKAKSSFLSSMSHDIRTPMNAIIGMTDLALNHFDDTDYAKDCLLNVKVASGYLLDIINNILDMSRIESGKFTLSKDIISLPKLIYNILLILNHSVEVKSQELLIEVRQIKNEEFIGDSVRITQILMNILSNAVKFTPNGGKITFEICQAASSEEGCCDYIFTISDTGIGMSSGFVEQVFQTFTRDESPTTTKIEGTGLGMAIAKNLTELMGGTVDCQSELGKGTSFIVKLPMKLPEKCTEKAILNHSQDFSVLILGENEWECGNQVKLFRELGVRTDYAGSTEIAIKMTFNRMVNGKSYDFLIINQLANDKSGIDTIKKITDTPDLPKMTYVLAAKDYLMVEKSRAYDAGISMLVQTPLFPSTAVSILNQTIKLRDNDREKNVVNLEGRRILLAEDNAMNRKVAINILKETKAVVYEAMNGKEAVSAFKEHEAGFFDVILMDIQMPVMDGYEATAAIRSVQREDAAVIPIYAMTANTFDEDVRQVREAGMNGHLGKPYVSAELYSMLDKAINQ